MELCRSAIFRENVLKALQARNDSEVTIDVDPRMLSVALGQKKENLQHFSKHGYTVHHPPGCFAFRRHIQATIGR